MTDPTTEKNMGQIPWLIHSLILSTYFVISYGVDFCHFNQLIYALIAKNSVIIQITWQIGPCSR